MAVCDFPKTTELPHLAALDKSFAVNAQEQALKDLFIAVFREYLSTQAHDLNVSGCAHLGSFDFIKKTINSDGLSILQGDREEYATRYLYRAWQARDTNGRGMHFLRTYLQLLFPNVCQVAQLWQGKDKAYPLDLHSVLEMDADGNHWTPDPEKYWLTSRVEIALDLTVTTRSILTLTNIFRSILPARLVPQFRFWLKFEAEMSYYADWRLLLYKHSDSRLRYCGRVITARPDAMWKLGKNGDKNAPKLKQCRVRTETAIVKECEARYRDLPRIGEPNRKLDGTWKIPPAGHFWASFELKVVE